LLGQLVLDKGALALVVGMSGVILLLLTGTELLDWYWLVLLTALSLGAGLYQLRGKIPSLYRLAQRIDRRMGLADALSTAFHFSVNPDRHRQAICESQRNNAEETAARVDVREALPYHRSRFLVPAAGLALVAFGLFAVRYVVTGSISLEPSLLKIAYENFFASPAEQAKNQAKRLNLVPDAFNPGNPENPTAKNDLTPEDPLQSEDSANGDNPQSQDNSKQTADGKGDQNAEGGDKGDKDKGKEGDSKDGKQSDKDGQGKEGNQDKSGNPNENSSAFNKLKDALSNMLNKMKPGDSSKSGQNSKQQQQQQNDSGEKGQQSQQKSDDPGSKASADSNQNGDKSQSEDQQNADQSGKPTNQEAGSGAGKADGDKAAKDAKMLEAMGKVSELIGKRSATVTGEVMVEVGSTKQQLKTAWSDQKANHGEAGSEIHRDEVPLMDQQMVEKYFEEIRKTPATPKPAKK
jgi:hypothetical protein